MKYSHSKSDAVASLALIPAQTKGPLLSQTRKRALAALLLAAAALCWSIVLVRQRATAQVQEHLRAGIAAAQQAQAREAESEWRQAMTLEPKNADAPLLLGQLFLSTHQWAKGVTAFQTLLKLYPNAPHAHGDLATCLYQYGDQMGAYAAAQEELKRDPDHIPSLMIAARVSSSLHNEKLEDSSLHRLVTLLPNNAVLLRLYAERLTNNSRFRDAEPILERLILAAPNDPQGYSMRGLNRFNSDATPEGMAQAEADFKRAIRLSPTIPISHLYLGKLYRREGRKAEALAELETAYHLAPESIAPCFELSQLYELTGAREQAAQLRAKLATLRQEDDLKNTLQKRCVTDRNNFDNHLRLGEILLKNGELHDATYYLNRAALLRPHAAAAQTALQRLALAAQTAPPEQDIASRLLTEQTASSGNP